MPPEHHAAEKLDPLLSGARQRAVARPPQYPDLYRLYRQHLACFWTADEIDLEGDLKDWHELRPEERHFLLHVLAFFAASDGIVIENLNLCFSSEVRAAEAKAFYGIQNAMENVHSVTYSLLIDRYIADPDEKDDLFNAIATMPAVRAKADWAVQWMSREMSFAERLVAFACVEGILFSGSFCAIYYMKKRGKLPGLCVSNSLIARDEGLHTDFACAVYALLRNRLSDEVAQDIVRGAVAAERVFICEALSCDLIGMNARLMAQYIEFVADRLLTALGHPKLYDAENPFDWMEMVSFQTKANFFEGRVTEYQKAGVLAEGAGRGFALDVDF
jgi:ribonucleoside-diphosphate reductase subunit M2